MNLPGFWVRLRSLFGATVAGLRWSGYSPRAVLVPATGPRWRRVLQVFKRPQQPAAFDVPQPPPFAGPPDSELGVPVPIRVVVASNGAVTIAATDITAYSNGFEFCISLRSKEGIDGRALGFVPPSRENESDGLLRIDVRFADGRSASSDRRRPGQEIIDYYLKQRDGLEPVLPRGPVLSPTSGGGGGHRWNFHYWVWPLPPEGKVTLACGWPAYGLQLSEVELDGTAIRHAGESSTSLWR